MSDPIAKIISDMPEMYSTNELDNAVKQIRQQIGREIINLAETGYYITHTGTDADFLLKEYRQMLIEDIRKKYEVPE